MESKGKLHTHTPTKWQSIDFVVGVYIIIGIDVSVQF